MANSCNVKTMSYISASLQLMCSIILLLGASFLGAANKEQTVDAFGSCISLVASLAVTLLVALMIGIKQNRASLVAIYVYIVVVLTTVIDVSVIVKFVIGCMQRKFYNVFVDFLLDLILVVTNILMFAPIYVLHSRMRYATLHAIVKGKQVNVKNVPKFVQKKQKKQRKKKVKTI